MAKAQGFRVVFQSPIAEYMSTEVAGLCAKNKNLITFGILSTI
jgi:hypothetical protein